LDTNVLSEALKPAPEVTVVRWLDEHFASSAISSITVFELSVGVAMLPAGRRRSTLERAIERLARRFGARIYGFDRLAAVAAAELFETARSDGHPLHQVSAKLADLQIAGIARAYDLTLATRNVADFEGLGLELANPWSG
jgi:hypothetical protein